MKQTSRAGKENQESSLTLLKYSWNDWTIVAEAWQRLHEQARASIFLKREWVETWIETFGTQLKPEILIFRDKEVIVGACIISTLVSWRWYVPVQRAYLNCTGEPECDDTCLEYNRILCLPGYDESVSKVLVEYLRRKRWDEFVLNGMEVRKENKSLFKLAPHIVSVERSSWYVDLDHLRSNKTDYASSLSSNTRRQIHRSIRLYEELYGKITVQQFDREGDMISRLDELSSLHQRSWVARNQPGVFSSEKFVRFHRSVIQRLSRDGSVHVLRVIAGRQTVGMLYNFFCHGRIYFYQSGFSYENDARMKPGLMTHFMAIDHYLRNCPEMLEYDFLAGDSQYKRSLSKSQRPLHWIVVRRPNLRSTLVEVMRRVKRTMIFNTRKVA